MIVLTRALARQARILIRRSLQQQGPRNHWPLLVCRTSAAGLALTAMQDGLALCYQKAAPDLPEETLTFSASLLAKIEGRDETPVFLEQTAPTQGQLRWTEGAVPRAHAVEMVPVENVPALPSLPERLSSVAQGILSAMERAARIAAPQASRLALSRIVLRGQRNDIVASDGRQLLLQGGFAFPWKENLLIPRLSVYGSRELPVGEGIRMGATDTQVALAVGPWTLLLPIDRASRYPPVDDIVPRAAKIRSRLQLDPQDAAFLAGTLPRLSATRDDATVVTLELGPTTVLRWRTDEAAPPTEIALSRSRSSGPATRLCLLGTHFRQALALNLTSLEVVTAERPLVWRDQERVYVCMPLEPKTALPPHADALRLVSATAATETLSLPARSSSTMSHVPPPGPHNGTPTATRNGETASLLDLLADAEALRTQLHEATGRCTRLVSALKQQRRQARAVQLAMSTLRQLQFDH